MGKEIEVLITKKCSRCQRVKPVNQFRGDKRRRTGLSNPCKLCKQAIYRSWYKRHKDTDKYREARRISQKSYVERNPERQEARRLAKQHKSQLLKPECERCGAASGLHMHHSDYSKPLDVITLCVLCHEQAHHGVLI